jgi:hypothetical protein
MGFQMSYGRPPRDPAELLPARGDLTDAELVHTIRATYKRIVARFGGTTEEAMRTCEALLRIHRETTKGSRAARAQIARMLKEPAGLPHQPG